MKSSRAQTVITALLFLLLARSAFAAGVTLAWDPNDEADVAGYLVKYGDQPGDYHQRVDVGRATTLSVAGLTSGRTYYFTVQAYAADGAYSAPATELSATSVGTPAPDAATATFLSVPGPDGRLATPVLQWTTAPGAEAYVLRVGSSPGAADVVETGDLQTTSYPLPALPFDRPYVARVYTRQAGRWSYSELTFQMPDAGGAARILAPRNGQQGVTSGQTFRWDAIAQAQAYTFQVGTTAGGRDVIDSGTTLRTAWTTATLPAGARLYARVATQVAGHWYTHEIEFVSAPKAMLLYPYNRATDPTAPADTSAHETFVWSGVTEAQAYRLALGTTPGARDLVDTGDLSGTTFPVQGLEPGRTYYARVQSRIQGVWEEDAVSFTTSWSARFTRPLAADGSDLGAGLAWTTILGAEAYAVRIGTALGLADLADSGDVLGTDYETPALPAGQPLFARVSTRYGGTWESRDTTLTLAGAALIAPALDASGAATVNPLGQPLTWTPISNAEAYRVYVGTTAGGQDLLDTGEIHTTTALATSLPLGRRLYVAVWTKANGLWNGTATSFVTK